MRGCVATLTAWVVLAGMGACTRDTATPEPDTPMLPSAPASAPSGAVAAGSRQTLTPEPEPTWDDAAHRSVVDVATRAMTAFARPDLPHDQWWAGLEPLMDPQAATDYVHVDPARIPATRVDGPAILTDQTSVWLARVSVPTDAGAYTVVAVRTSADHSWRVARILPPKGS